jgi:hypothetical protein
MPVAYWCGFSYVALSITRSASNTVTSAHCPGRSRPAVVDADLGGVRRGHLAHGVLEREQLLLAHVAAEHAGERAVVTRMGVALRGHADLHGRAVRADGHERLAQRELHVLFGVVEVDGRHGAAVREQRVEQNVHRLLVRKSGDHGAHALAFEALPFPVL